CAVNAEKGEMSMSAKEDQRSVILHIDERGNMLVFSLIILVVFTIMGLGLMTMTTNTLKSTTTERDDQAVYYIAEAGLVQQRAHIYNQIKTVYTQLKAMYEQIEDPELKSEFNFDEQFT